MEFNFLQPGIQLKIFSHLSVCEVMKSRLVCRQWASLINSEFKFKQLRCMQLSCLRKWLTVNDFYLKSTRCVKSLLDFLSNDAKFSRVKFLFVTLSVKYDEVANVYDLLNSFKCLEELKFRCEIHDAKSYNPDELQKKQFFVSLDRLKTASISFEQNLKISVVLNLPSLLHLNIDSLRETTIGHPQKLRTLSTRNVFDQEPVMNYTQFTSLTIIYTEATHVRSIRIGFFDNIPNLQELHFTHSYFIPCYSVLKLNLPEATEGTAKLRIYYLGFELALNQIHRMILQGDHFPEAFARYDSGEMSTTFAIQNLHRSIDNNPYIESIGGYIHCGELIRQLDDARVSEALFQKKFSKVFHLRLNGNVDGHRILNFIDKLKIKELSLERCDLSQPFFQKLAKIQPSIMQLTIRPELTTNYDIVSEYTDLALDFVCKLRHLHCLYFFDCRLPLTLLTSLVKAKKFIPFIQFKDFHVFSKGKTIDSLECFSLGNYQIPGNVLSFLDALRREFEPGEFLCYKKLWHLLNHLKFEKESHLFMMRKEIYDQTHSICLSKEQARWLNIRY